MADARKAALLVLERCRRGGAWSDAVIGSVMDAQQLSGRDRRFAAALAYGVMQNRMLLDHAIERCSSMELKRIEPKVLDLLRIGAYQLLLMDRVPASAAVDSSVQLCRSLGFARAVGFVNAVLRRMSGEKDLLPEGSDAFSLSIRWSHPLWLTETYIRLLGTQEAIRLLEADNAPAPITLQVNTLRTDTASLEEELRRQGLSVERHSFVPDCLLLRGGDVHRLDAFLRGDFYVQDAAARMAVMAAGAQSGQRILDACAAPGGKTFAAAIESRGAEIVACDIHENKLRRIEDGAKRLGLERILFRALDAREYVPDFAEAFDLVIADVPCSGLGVIRKKPDIRYKDPEAFSALPEIQYAILRNLSRYVRPGGTLLYSTCTIRPEENEAVCARFLAEDPSFAACDFSVSDGSRSSNGKLQFWPQRSGTDGFFISKMKKWTEQI